MQIVIDINEDVFTRLFDNGTEDYAIANDDLFAVAKSIRNGTPLPKGGRLIDANEVCKLKKELCVTECGCCALDGCFYDRATTIIETDKEEEA